MRHTVCGAALMKRRGVWGGVFCGGAALVKRDKLVLYGGWKRGRHGGNEEGREGARGRMFHFASQACATVDERMGRRRRE